MRRVNDPESDLLIGRVLPLVATSTAEEAAHAVVRLVAALRAIAAELPTAARR